MNRAEPLRLGLVGRDIAGSLSPRLHAKALELSGLTGRYDLLPCPDEAAVRQQIQRLRDGEVDGLNVTAPWKPLARALCDDLAAVRMRRKPVPPLAINTLLMRDGRLLGAGTDGPGLTDVLFGAGVPLPGARVVLLGAGGAAQAIAADLLEVGAQDLTITARDPAQAQALVQWLQAGFGSQAVRQAAWGQPRALAPATLVVHATSWGHGQLQPPDDAWAWLPWSAWRRKAVLVDLAYAAGGTPTPWQGVALADGRTVEGYAYARTGYHRALDALRKNGWRGQGPVPWEHEPNRGFLRALAALSNAAGAIGETDEQQRCAQFLRDSSPAGARELGF